MSVSMTYTLHPMLGHLQEQGLHNFPGQSVPMHYHSSWEEIVPNVLLKYLNAFFHLIYWTLNMYIHFSIQLLFMIFILIFSLLSKDNLKELLLKQAFYIETFIRKMWKEVSKVSDTMAVSLAFILESRICKVHLRPLEFQADLFLC